MSDLQKLKLEYSNYQAQTPILQNISLSQAIKLALTFKDNPTGQLENEIDSILSGYSLQTLETFLQKL